MRLAASAHVHRRMNERGISWGQIEVAVREAHTHYPGNDGSTAHVWTSPEGRTLLVWLIRKSGSTDEMLVKSAAWREDGDR